MTPNLLTAQDLEARRKQGGYKHRIIQALGKGGEVTAITFADGTTLGAVSGVSEARLADEATQTEIAAVLARCARKAARNAESAPSAPSSPTPAAPAQPNA